MHYLGLGATKLADEGDYAEDKKKPYTNRKYPSSLGFIVSIDMHAEALSSRGEVIFVYESILFSVRMKIYRQLRKCPKSVVDE